jgi:hypothetical protein
MLAGILVMFSLLGNVMGKVRRNFYVGVRTPWTLASERVWNDTHRLAAKLFVGAGIIGLLAVVLPLPLPAVIITVVASMIVAGLIPVVYSLILYKRLESWGARLGRSRSVKGGQEVRRRKAGFQRSGSENQPPASKRPGGRRR